MLSKLKRAWKAAPVATFVLGLSVLVAFGFSMRLTMWFFRPPPPHEVVLETWMTPRMISHMWQVPPEVMQGFLDINRPKGRPENLAQIADDKGVDVQALVQSLEQSIRTFNEEKRPKK